MKKTDFGFNYKILVITVFASFLIFGFSENIRGPAIARIQADFSLTGTQLGVLLATNSFGYLLACFYTASLSRKIGLKRALIIGLAGMAASGVGICFSAGYIMLVACYFAMYLGNGMLEITLGLIAAETFTKRTGTMLNLSHFFYGLSSTVAPMLSAGLMGVKLGTGALGWRYMYLIVLSLALLPIIPALMGRIPRKTDGKRRADAAAFLKNPTSWLIFLILSFGVACELGVGSWLVNLLEKRLYYTESAAALALTGFFVCFTLSRLVIGPLTDRIGYAKSLIIFTAFSGAAITAGILLGRGGVAPLIAAGFGIAPVYPTVMALVAKLYAKQIDAAMTVTLTIMGVVVVICNMFMGALADFFERLFRGFMEGNVVGTAYAAAYLFLGFCALAACVSAAGLFRRLRRTGEAARVG